MTATVVRRARAAVHSAREALPSGSELRSEAVAGLPGAIGSVPDGMAASVLAGVNPVHGLYASFAGPIAGGLTTSSRMMVITTTSAAALAAGSALADVDPGERAGALILLTLLAGGLMIAAGAARLGRLTRFVPYSVMLGFLTGVALNIFLGQLPDLVGATASGSVAITKALDLLRNLDRVEPAALATGLAAIGILIGLGRTRLAPVGALVGLVVPSIVVVALGAESVVQVADGGAIPVGLPVPALPELQHLTTNLVLGAFAVAALVLVQGAGVSESAPNDDGLPGDANRDFTAQGVGNVAAAIFQGQPVGGSVGQTALNRSAGARGRWASIFSGVWMVVILLLLSGLVGKVAMPTLAAVLILASVASFRPADVMAVMRTGSTSRAALVITFTATLLLPVAMAVGIGVAISLLMQLNRDALDLRVVQLAPGEGGTLVELPAEGGLPSGEVVVLDVYGSLLYAGARTLQARLPDPSGTVRPVVVLRMRGRTTLGATFFLVLSTYAAQLAQQGGRLYVSGVDPMLMEQMRRNGRTEVGGSVKVFVAEPVLGASTLAAISEARTWLIEHPAATEPDPEVT